MAQIQTLKKGDETIYPLTHMKGVVDDNGNTMDVLLAEAEKRALRKLFVAAGAEYNDTDEVIQKTAPWGTEETWVKNADGTYTYSEVPAIVNHLPKHYYLNGLGDITEEQMMTIYNAPRNGLYACAYYSAIPRVVMCSGAPSYAGLPTTLTSIFAESNLEILGFNKPLSALNTKTDRAFNACKKLSHIVGSYMTLDATDTYLFHQCYQLKSLLLRVRKSIQFASSSYIYKRSVLYLIQNAKPTSAITITLHADAYARIANQPDIIEALGAQPLITLVSA